MFPGLPRIGYNGSMPAFVAIASLLAAVTSQVLRERRHREELAGGNYPDSVNRRIVAGSYDVAKRVNRVAWIGDPDRLLYVEADDLWPRKDNIFYRDKLAEVAAIVQDADPVDPVPFEPGYAFPEVIGLIDIRDSIQYASDGDSPVWTSGDEELDAWLADREQFIEDNLDDYYEYDDDEWDEDEDEEDVDLSASMEAAEAAAKQRLIEAMEAMEQQAVAGEWGDIGRIVYQVRDGNHRIFGAIAGGEPGVYVKVDPKDIQQVRQDRVYMLEQARRKLLPG